MIFKQELIDKILVGEKTETRRPVKDGKPCKYKEDSEYAVQPGRNAKGVAKIRVESVRAEKLREIDDEGARREGFGHVPWPRSAFFAYWQRLYGGCEMDEDVRVIRFRLAGA